MKKTVLHADDKQKLGILVSYVMDYLKVIGVKYDYDGNLITDKEYIPSNVPIVDNTLRFTSENAEKYAEFLSDKVPNEKILEGPLKATAGKIIGCLRKRSIEKFSEYEIGDDVTDEFLKDIIADKWKYRMSMQLPYEEEEDSSADSDDDDSDSDADDFDDDDSDSDSDDDFDESDSEDDSDDKINLDDEVNGFLRRFSNNDEENADDSSYKTLMIRKELSNKVKYAHLFEEKLKETVIGQQEAVKRFCETYHKAELLQFNENRPKATFLFVGPPGVGKTLLAETAAGIAGRPFQRYDMSEYAGDDDVASGLVGFEKTWRNSSPGVLTSYVEAHPNAIILFDEIEKAAPAVHKLFLQILEGARLTDKYTEKTVSFANTILIFTTNAGKGLYEDATNTNLSLLPQETVIDALRHDGSFPLELVSRFTTGNIIIFNYVDVASLERIAKNAINTVARKFNEKYGTEVVFKYKNDLPRSIIMHESLPDARIVASKAKSIFENLIVEALHNIISSGHSITELKEIVIDFIKEGKDNAEAYKYLPPVQNNDIDIYTPINVLYITDKVGKAEIADYKWINIHIAHNADEMQQLLAGSVSFDFVVVDLLLGCGDKIPSDVLAKSNPAMGCIKLMRGYSEGPSVYVQKFKELSDHDLSVLFEMGISATLPPFDENENEWQATSELEYFKRTMKLLKREGKVFSYDHHGEIEDASEELKHGYDEIIKPDSKYIIKDDDSSKSSSYRAHFWFDHYKVEAVSGYDKKTRGRDAHFLLDYSDSSDLRFSDIIGQDDAKAQLSEFIAYIDNPIRFEAVNCPVSKGILLHGNPGTGKTMLAKALANECKRKVAFIQTSGSDLAGAGNLSAVIEQINNLFETARRHSPSIIFIDEFDSIASKRKGGGGNDSFDKSVLEKLLTEMDGFKEQKDKIVFVIAATNARVDHSYSDVEVEIDPAISRRFGKSIYVDLPTLSESEELMNRTLKSMQQDEVSDDEFLSKVQDFLYGEKKDDEKVSKDEKAKEELSTARHEAGHAYMTWKMGEQPSLMTVAARGDFLGFVHHGRPSKLTLSKTWILNQIDVCLAGRASEIVFYGEEGINSGASSDLKNATFWARRLVTELGMVDGELAVVSKNMIDNSPISVNVMKQVNAILDEEMEKTKKEISAHKETIEKIAQAAIHSKDKYITTEDIIDICEKDAA